MTRVVAKDSQTNASKRSRGSFSQATVSRWMRGQTAMPSHEKVVAFAEAYGEDEWAALEAAGRLPKGAAELPHHPHIDLSTIDVADLAAEVARRLKHRDKD